MFCKIKTKRVRAIAKRRDYVSKEANRSIDPVNEKNSGSVGDAFLKRGKGDTRIDRLRLRTRAITRELLDPGFIQMGNAR